MTDPVARILLVADTHLGFDLPLRPRIERRRRGHDFLANFERALAPAREGEVGLVVHGGDLLDRAKVPPALVEMAMAPLIRVAQAGVPVYLVPGNHERSRIPLHLWAAHPNVHLFDQPRTFLCPTAVGTLALSGFPFNRRVRDVFCDLVRQTRYLEAAADARLLCLHQTVEGAQVGPGNYTFRSGPDVIHGSDIPAGFCALLAGHIHRAQTLTHDLRGRPLGAPTIYPGSVERTSFAERHEEKGYCVVEIGVDGAGRGQLVRTTFAHLPARPMATITLEASAPPTASLAEWVRDRLSALDPDAVVRIEITGPHASQARQQLGSAALRQLAPRSMNISLAMEHARARE